MPDETGLCMKKSFFLAALILLFLYSTDSIFAQTTGLGDGSNLHPASQRGPQGFFKSGFQDSLNQYVIPPKYDGAVSFSEGLAGVGVGGLWGFINPKGMMVIRPQFLNVKIFQKGLCVVQDQKRNYELINQRGKLVKTLHYRAVEDFSEGLAAVQKDYGLWGFANAKGVLVIPYQFNNVGKFRDGLCNAQLGKWGFINTQGQWAIQPIYDQVNAFRGGVVYVTPHGGQPIPVDKNGKLLTQAEVSQLQAASPDNPLKQAAALNDQKQAQTLQYFHDQKNTDELYLYSNNSMLPPEFKPIAGEGVLLVAEIRRWDEKRPGYKPNKDVVDKVKFEVLSPNGVLKGDKRYPLVEGDPTQTFKATTGDAFAPNAAVIWVLTDPGSTEPVTVKATLLAEGSRAPFVGGHTEDLFVINPILPSAGQAAMAQIEAAQKQNYGSALKITSCDRVCQDHQEFPPQHMTPRQRLAYGKSQGPLDTQLTFHGAPKKLSQESDDINSGDNLEDSDVLPNEWYYQHCQITHVNPVTGELVLVGPRVHNVNIYDFIRFEILGGNQGLPDQKTIQLARPDALMSKKELLHSGLQKTGDHWYWSHGSYQYFKDYRDEKPNHTRDTVTTNAQF